MAPRKEQPKKKKPSLRDQLGFGKIRPRRKRSPRWKLTSKHQEELLKQASRSTLNTIPRVTFRRGGTEAPPIIDSLVSLIPSRGLLLPKDYVVDHDTDVRIRASMIRSLGYGRLNQSGVGMLIRDSFRRAVLLVDLRKTSRELFWTEVAGGSWMSPYLDGTTIKAFLLRLILAFRKGNSHHLNESYMRKAMRAFNDYLTSEPGNGELGEVEASGKVSPASEPRTDQAKMSSLRKTSSVGHSETGRDSQALQLTTKQALEEANCRHRGRLSTGGSKSPHKRSKDISCNHKGAVSAARGMSKQAVGKAKNKFRK